MRRAPAPTLLALAVTVGLVLALAGAALTGAAPARASGSARTGVSARAAAARRPGAKRHAWSLRLAPAPDDFTLVQIRFPGIGRRAIARGLPSIEMQAPFGADYLAAATPRAGLSPGGAQVLVLLVNRPSALEDPASVRLRLSARRGFAAHEVRRVENPFAAPAAGAAPGLCDLATRGSALQGSDLAPLRSAGAALEGFGIAAAVAQAYDVACALPYESAFKQVVTGVSAQPQPAPPQPAPPTPPVGKLPGEGCVPSPGYFCPAAVASGSPAAALDGDRRVSARAH